MTSERPVDPMPKGLPDDRAELWYVCTGTINSHEPSDEVKLMALGIKRQLELEARAYHAERQVAELRARVAELEANHYQESAK